ncbi:hypothetical protein NDK50_11015 [Paraburkholderia bryophila]|uniref:hypothetical protein n=1 Tax=Paraburkholderia bryophila TaxID=420952 RepID=UPI00234912BC|nr:hypothetical protein [Paraburkholderia bryophila]WCM18020.1 hypothetical protein NDK50_11015 [Paraburkholderia bryophila]
MEEIMADVSLFKAFSILLNGLDHEIGEGARWKRGIFRMAMSMLALFPVANMISGQTYSGELPPTVPLLHTVGTFSQVYASPKEFRRKFVLNFYAEDGKIYQVPLEGIDSNEKMVERAKSGESFRVEGFSLHDGQGLLWLTWVADMNDRELLGRDGQNRLLKRYRDPFSALLLVEYGLTLPLWVVSLFNALKLRKRLSKDGAERWQ